MCGDGSINGNEVCDPGGSPYFEITDEKYGDDLNGETCASQAGDDYIGDLDCDNNCLGYDTSNCVYNPPFDCGTSTVTDIEGVEYTTVQIGNQCWAGENLQSAPTSGIYLMQDNADWSYAWQNNIDAYCYLPETSDYYPGYDCPSFPEGACPYGIYVNWHALDISAEDNLNGYPDICEQVMGDGWHIPSTSEWTTLHNFVLSQQSSETAEHLKATYGWSTQYYGDGVDTYGFEAIAPGTRYTTGYWPEDEGNLEALPGCISLWWENTGNDQANVWVIRRDDLEMFEGVNPNKGSGFQVRCIII
jgi:uncharacterized protein (TIGR02145 family)